MASSSSLDVWSSVARMGSKLRPMSDPFFADGDAVCRVRTCQYLTQEDDEELLHKEYEEFGCAVAGCGAKFSQLLDSEVHYATKHRHACSVCKKSLPSAHLLGLHVAESHDSFFDVASAKKPSYECFLETCGVKFWNAEERREHCVGSHQFPADFKYDKKQKKKKKKKEGADGGAAKKKKRKGPKNDAMDVEEEKPLYLTQKSDDPSVFLRRNSLTSTAPTYAKQISLDSSGGKVPTPPQKRRGPVSLAKMGMGAPSKGARHSICFGSPVSDTPPNCGSERRLDALAGFKSGIPQLAKNGGSSNSSPTVRSPSERFSSLPSSSKSSTATSSPSPRPSWPAPGDHGKVYLPPLQNASQGSPSKSRIPVLKSPGCPKVPKKICFGFGTSKAFNAAGKRSGNWHQSPGLRRSAEQPAPLDNSSGFVEEMATALD